VVVFLLYLIVLRYWTASRASYGFVIIPFVTIVLSAWLDNEPVGVGLVLGVSSASMYSSWCLSIDTKNNIITMACCNPHQSGVA